MLEPQKDEERKALRLAMAMNHMPSEEAGGFINEEWRDSYLRVLAEARAIVREEHGNPRSPHIENELAQVRAEIRLCSEILRAFPEDMHPDSKGSKEISKQWERFLCLLSRERELMVKSEPEGGDRG